MPDKVQQQKIKFEKRKINKIDIKLVIVVMYIKFIIMIVVVYRYILPLDVLVFSKENEN